ncbi:FKBP-type peptidyl-prolyl cis-trans isomerase [Candidatus Saccharibacteria bacterium]|nr:FKBP-type peptidyl-prolyl cis-trans isomerase [Candidatus Saccharibacteria bacterium]
MGQLDNFTPFSDEVNELQKIDLVEGTGDEVKAGAKVTVHYTGAYAVNGEIFDSSVSRGETITFGLDEVIQGWSEGVPGMKVGGKRRLIIPGSLAYGEATEGYTPGDGGRPLGTLVFDIELFAIENQ